MIWYLEDALRPLVRVEIKQHGQKLDKFKKLVEKTVDTKAKAVLRPCSYARKTDRYFLQGSQPSAAKTNTWDQLIKDLRVEEPKFKPQKLKAPAPQYFTNNGETFEQAWKEKKKKEK